MTVVRYLCMSLILSSLIALYGCKKRCSCYKYPITPINKEFKTNKNLKWEVSVIKSDNIKNQISKFGYNRVFGFHLITKFSKKYIVFYDSLQILRGINLEDQSDFFITKADPRYRFSKAYSVITSNDTFYIVDSWGKKFYSFFLDNKFNIVNNSFFDFSARNELSNFFLLTNPGYKTIAYKHPNIYIPYGKKNSFNLIDKKSYLEINTVTGKIKKIINYPACFHCSAVYDKHSLILVNSNYDKITLFTRSDEIIKVNGEDSLLKQSLITHNCRYKDFDNSKIKNLAYIRKYYALSECNQALINVDSDLLVVIKKEEKNKLDAISSHVLFLMDNELNLINEYKIKESIYPLASFEYGRGFIVFSDSLNKIYRYELVYDN